MGGRSLEFWGVIGTWFQALGTVGAIGYAFWEVARNRKVETKRARRAHAESVSAWLVRRRDIVLSNASEQLVYGVVVVPVWVLPARQWTAEEMVKERLEAPTRRGQPWTVLGVLQPGRSTVPLDFVIDSGPGRWALEIAFTDREGHHWIRRSDGGLEELSSRPIEYFKLPESVQYLTAEN